MVPSNGKTSFDNNRFFRALIYVSLSLSLSFPPLSLSLLYLSGDGCGGLTSGAPAHCKLVDHGSTTNVKIGL